MHPCLASYPASAFSQSKPLLRLVCFRVAIGFEPPLNLLGSRPGRNQRALNSHALAPGRHCARAQSFWPLRAPVGAVANNPAQRASGAVVALRQALPAAVGFGFW